MVGAKRLATCWAWRVVAAIPLVAACSGCGNWWWTSFLDPTQVSGDFRRPMITEIQRSLSFEDTPPGIPGSEEPTAEDLVAVLEEYRLEKDDAIGIRIPRFNEYEMVTDLMLIVNEVGDVQIPQLGWIHVGGMTAREVEAEIRDQTIQKGIFRADGAPPIQVTFPQQRQRFFNIFGGVTAADTYRILEPDFRLLDALSLAGGLPEHVEWVYVYRSQPRPTRTQRAAAAKTSEPRALPPDRGPEAPPVAPVSISDLGTAAATGHAVQSSPPTSAATSGPGSERELIEAIAPASSSHADTPPSEPSPAASEPSPTAPKFIYLNGQWVDVSQKTGTKPAPADSSAERPAAPGGPAAPPPVASAPVTWESVEGEAKQRVIRIPAAALRRGEGRYNIVIRHRDVVRVDPGPLGEFYMLGQVARPGVYTLTGREITLKQAIAAAGGLAILAWPSRCEVIRRLDQDREQTIPVNLEQIFAGNQPDVYIRQNDIINVGTNIITPFLATIRTSFRMSYGFGFVYDRNFGDIDSFAGQQNPTDRRRAELQQRFPGLFP